MLSLTNAVGAGRMRQAARELVKAYIHGVDSAALDDVVELLAWKQGKSRDEICNMLREKFGEKNPEMQVLNR